jgi:hypothetical protein
MKNKKNMILLFDRCDYRKKKTEKMREKKRTSKGKDKYQMSVQCRRSKSKPENNFRQKKRKEAGGG